jgi:hypothetical protein
VIYSLFLLKTRQACLLSGRGARLRLYGSTFRVWLHFTLPQPDLLQPKRASRPSSTHAPECTISLEPDSARRKANHLIFELLDWLAGRKQTQSENRMTQLGHYSNHAGRGQV